MWGLKKEDKTLREEDEKKGEKQENEDLLEGKQPIGYRALVARANYLAQNRVDIQYVVKELSRGMAKLTKGDYKKMKRLGRHLYSDSDWAGCRKTAKSTSGGIVLRAKHFVRGWSSTQKCIALSSGEAELVALAKASTEPIGILQLLADWGQNLEGEVLVDSSAALGTMRRKGCGEQRHVQCWGEG